MAGRILQIDFTRTLLSMGRGESLEFGDSLSNYKKLRNAAHYQKRTGHGEWTINSRVTPGKIVVTRVK